MPASVATVRILTAWRLSRAARRRSDSAIAARHAHNVFIRDEDAIYRTYRSEARGDEVFGTLWSYLDITPLGRQETWEKSPDGYPQDGPYQWWRRHDEY